MFFNKTLFRSGCLGCFPFPLEGTACCYLYGVRRPWGRGLAAALQEARSRPLGCPWRAHLENQRPDAASQQPALLKSSTGPGMAASWACTPKVHTNVQ